MTKRICKKCLKNIDLNKDKYVLLGTYHKTALEERFYHFTCFVEWYEGQVALKVQNTVKDMQEKALGIVGNLLGAKDLDIEFEIGGIKHV